MFCGCGSGSSSAWDWSSELRRPDGTNLEFPSRPDKPVLLLFFASWASPCVPMLDALSLFGGRARVVAVSCDTEPAKLLNRDRVEVAVSPGMSVARRFGVTVLPTVVLLDRLGQQVGRFEGYSPSVCSVLGVRLDSLNASP
ncbi:MAG: TlpA disulfide reductase family protein [candidate division WOR-3 bacterium]